MKITIDTKEDSKEEIKKAINFLSSISDGAVYSNYSNEQKPEHQKDIFSDNASPSVGGGIFSMFGDASSPSQSSPQTAPSSPDIHTDANAEEEKEPEKKPHVIIEY